VDASGQQARVYDKGEGPLPEENRKLHLLEMACEKLRRAAMQNLGVWQSCYRRKKPRQRSSTPGRGAALDHQIRVFRTITYHDMQTVIWGVIVKNAPLSRVERLAHPVSVEVD
jgi:hypothetical protein